MLLMDSDLIESDVYQQTNGSINDYVEVSAPVVCWYKTMILIKQVLLWQYSSSPEEEEGFMYLLCPNNVQWHTVHKALFQLYCSICI